MGGAGTVANVYSQLLAPTVPRNAGLVPRCGTGSSGSIGLVRPSRDNSDGGSCSAGSAGGSDGNESEASTGGGRRSAGLVLARRPPAGPSLGGSSASHGRRGVQGLVLAKSHSRQSVASLGSVDSGASSHSGGSGGGPRRGLVLAKSTDSLGASRLTPSTITVGGTGMSMGMSRTSGIPGSLSSLGSLGNPSPRSHATGETGGASGIGMSPSTSSSLVRAGIKRYRGSGLVLANQSDSDKKAKIDEEEG